jgi:hypothetical protein
LVLTATAINTTDVASFVEGFTKGMNITDPIDGKCGDQLAKTLEAYGTALAMVSQLDDKSEESVGDFGFQIAHSFRVCGGAVMDIQEVFMTIGDDLKHMNMTEVANRLFANMFQLNMKFQQVKIALSQGDMETVGEVIAAVYKMIILGENTTRTIRQLSMFTALVQKTAVDFNATYLSFLGFIEEGNTTVAVNDYVAFSNHTSDLVALTTVLEAAIQKMDLPTIISTLQSLNSAFMTVVADSKTVGAEVSAFVQRDLPLFASAEQIQKVGQYLFANIPTTMMNFQRITNALKNADYREFGHGSGAFYNQLRAGAMSSF